ncbi:tryptophan halogenase family protein [Lentzea jiangxiensis]|uniref:Tryptophan halogenase n=1 Tax=Lentzea jiangxiensis TaxID=641025 RepID=A0A1H0TT13_9PSEU|nr:tryptophan halogenase family protein [Lentzea jiangxiensis]SDP57011.1 tryptophan halogenase [Lentzea jiangxiensis]
MKMNAGRPSALDELVQTFSDDESAAVREWLGGAADAPQLPGISLRSNHEPLVEMLPRPAVDDQKAIRRVAVVGGGTAGYLTAIALRTKRPWLEVSLIESPSIPIIGVGEATVPGIVIFLHHYLGIDVEDFYRQVRPTWKQGIRFEWGPRPDGFMAPFDWDSNSIGTAGAVDAGGGIDGYTLQSLLMSAERAPVFDVGDRHLSLMKYLPFAYHLDNARFVSYLADIAKQRGVQHVEAKIEDVALSGDDWVDHLHTTDGRKLSYDFYVDCSGFRSMLLGKAFRTPFHSYASSLFTDSAVTGNVGHGGNLKPYTSAITMNSGWCWDIPTPQDDHLGYVYSSNAISDDQAAAELAARFPGVSEPRFVRFRVGRHEKAWRGNVMAIGNSYAFVEPLESTGILMITSSVQALVASLPGSWADPQCRDMVNVGLANRWDALRWFLSIHYRFNTRRDTPFWREVRANTDISGAQPMLDMYATGAPLRYRNPLLRTFVQGNAPTFYGLAGVETILLGQQVPTRLLHRAEPPARWQARRNAADAFVRRALPQLEALSRFHDDPALNQQLLFDADSWASPLRAEPIGML